MTALALLFVAALVVTIYFIPRGGRHRLLYEENRPWSYSLLTAPFDITIYRDSATVKELTDSVDRVLVPIFRRDEAPQVRVVAAINASHTLTARTKAQLILAVNRLYSDGVTSPEVAGRIQAGALPEVKFNEDGVNVSSATARFRSPRDAYALVDSLLREHPQRAQVQALELASLLEPNVVADAEATEQYRQSLLQPILAGIGVIQQGERIIDRGDIVTPQLYQVLRTYESTLDKKQGGARSDLARTLLGQLLFTALLYGLMLGFMAMYYPGRLRQAKVVAAMLVLMAGFFVFTVVMNAAFPSGAYIVPLAILPIVVQVTLDQRTAFFLYMLEVVLCAIVVSYPLEFIFVETVAGTAVLFSLKELSRRSQLLRSAGVAFAAYIVAYVGMELMATGSFSSLTWRMPGYFAINAVLISFAYILIFVFEKLFGLISVVTLVELADINTPLLRKLSTECPGTFQHSMAVSNLASEAAHAIGANVQLVRAGALYHDIGKIDNPAFFTENQHGVNPHDTLQPEQSARIIIGHVADGMRRASQAKLPQVIKDFITQHHGAGVAKYFLAMEQKRRPGEEVDPAPYTYPGPNPQTREASLLMMADTVEAASRSLAEHTDQSIRALVDRLIDGQVEQGLHAESPLSFRDIKRIKEIFYQRLRTIYHARIAYPDDKKKAAPQEEAAPGHE